MVGLLLAKARLKSEGTHWETIKERTGCVCRNVQGRGRQNAPHQNARGMHEEPSLISRFANERTEYRAKKGMGTDSKYTGNVRGKSHGVTDEKRHGRTHSGKLSNNAQGGALGNARHNV